MADDADFETAATPTLQDLATFLADELYSVDRLKRLENLHRNAQAEGAVIAQAASIQAAPALAEKKASLIEEGYNDARKAIGWALAQLVAHLLGVEAPTDLFDKGNLRPQDSAIGKAIAKTVIDGIAGDVSELVPGDDAAIRFMGMLGHLTIQSWAEGIIVEEFQSLHGLLHPIEEISKLGQELIAGMGLNRLARVALRPLAQVLVATPLNWKYQKQFRPALLSEGDILKAFLRGDYTQAEVSEELARLGYSDRRQDMLLKSAYRSLSLDDALVLVRETGRGRDFALATLRSQGYDEPAANDAIDAVEARRLAAIKDDSLAALRGAYADRRISDAEYEQFLRAIVLDDAERAAHEIAARTIRDVNTKRLSASQAEACVLAGVVPIAAYREALANEGYDDESALALELLLETKRTDKADVELLRKQKTDAAAAAAKTKTDALAAKQVEIDKARALARRGPLTELVRAAVRGLVPMSRVTDVLAAQYDADTVQIYVDDITAQRVAYLKQQAKADDATKAAALRHIDVGALDQAVLANVLTLAQFRQQLDALHFAPADADVLTATLTARKADRDAATQKRAQAGDVAKQRSVDLARFEQLVRRGVRTLADYDALLQALNFDDASRASLIELLQSKIDDDAAAAQARADAAAKNPAKGLTLEQYRRGVLLGLHTIDEFQTWLVQQRYTADAQAVLVNELRDDVAQADAARQQRDAAAAGVEPRAIPLATVARAARLGIVPTTLYEQRLTDAGYTADDIAIEMGLLTTEIADVQAARAKQAAADAARPAPSLSLAQIGAAVRAGVSHLEDYRAKAVELGLSVDDVNTLVRVLGDELAASTAARARRAQLEIPATPGAVSLSVLADAVRAGTLPLAGYVAQITAAGLDPVDVDLLASLLADELDAGG